MRAIAAIAISIFTFGCTQTPDPVSRSMSGDLPDPFIIVGDATAGMIAADELRADGLTVVTQLDGRAAGITTFCTGNAAAMALTPGQDLTSEERARCSEIGPEGWSWSALSTEKGVGFYVRFEFAQTLLDTAPNAL